MIFDNDERQNAGKKKIFYVVVAVLFFICRACPSLLSSCPLCQRFFNQELKEHGLKLKLNRMFVEFSLFSRNYIIILSSCYNSYRVTVILLFDKAIRGN